MYKGNIKIFLFKQQEQQKNNQIKNNRVFIL